MLLYVTNLSLDGYIEDASGDFSFSEPNDEQFVFVTDLIRPLGTQLYGRRLYESMAVWETDPSLAAQSPLFADFAQVWQAAEKIVYSTTLADVATQRTRIERSFDADAVRGMPGDQLIGGADLAAQAFQAGIVDEVHLFVSPVILGSGKPGLPRTTRVALELLDQRRFPSGTLYVRYAVR